MYVFLFLALEKRTIRSAAHFSFWTNYTVMIFFSILIFIDCSRPRQFYQNTGWRNQIKLKRAWSLRHKMAWGTRDWPNIIVCMIYISVEPAVTQFCDPLLQTRHGENFGIFQLPSSYLAYYNLLNYTYIYFIMFVLQTLRRKLYKRRWIAECSGGSTCQGLSREIVSYYYL